MKTHKILSLLSLLIAIGGCATQGDTVQRYTLAELNKTTATPDGLFGSHPSLQLSPVRLASFIDARGVLYQTDDIVLSEAGGHLWAEEIGAQLTRSLRHQIAAQCPSMQVIEASKAAAVDRFDYTLSVHVERFQGRHDGVAVVSGDWLLRDGANRLLERQSYVIEQPLADDGYPELVRSLGLAWEQLATQLAQMMIRRDERLQSITVPAIPD